jgi:hypothetical protein
MIATFSGTSAYTSKRLSDRYDCLSWSVEQLQKAGVHFQLPLSIITPNGAVEYVYKHLDKIVFKDS